MLAIGAFAIMREQIKSLDFFFECSTLLSLLVLLVLILESCSIGCHSQSGLRLLLCLVPFTFLIQAKLKTGSVQGVKEHLVDLLGQLSQKKVFNSCHVLQLTASGGRGVDKKKG